MVRAKMYADQYVSEESVQQRLPLNKGSVDREPQATECFSEFVFGPCELHHRIQ